MPKGCCHLPAQVNLNGKGSTTSWLSFPRSAATVVTAEKSAWDEGVVVEVGASGMRETSVGYAADVHLNVTAPGDRSQDQAFVVPVLLYVVADVVAMNSGWGLADARKRCRASDVSQTIQLTLGQTSDLAFQACGALFRPRGPTRTC